MSEYEEPVFKSWFDENNQRHIFKVDFGGLTGTAILLPEDIAPLSGEEIKMLVLSQLGSSFSHFIKNFVDKKIDSHNDHLHIADMSDLLVDTDTLAITVNGGVVHKEQKSPWAKDSVGERYKATIIEHFPGVKDARAKCPADSEDFLCAANSKVLDLIVHLNDNHRWTRQEIADWLETLSVDITLKTEQGR